MDSKRPKRKGGMGMTAGGKATTRAGGGKPGTGGGSTAKKQKKKNFLRESAINKKASVSEKALGVLVFCDQHRMREAQGEAVSLLRECVSEHFEDVARAGVAASTEGEKCAAEDDGKTVSALDAELSLLKEEFQYFSLVDIGVKGMLFLELNNHKLDPEKLVVKLLTEIRAGYLPKPRHVSRMIPAQGIMRATIAELEEHVPAVLAPHFGDATTPAVKFAVDFRKRFAAPTCVRTEFITKIASLVSPQHTVDLGAPEVTILVEVFKKTCAIAVTRRFQELKKFNLQAVAPLSEQEDE